MMNVTISGGDVDMVIQQLLDVPTDVAAKLLADNKKKDKKKNVGSD